MLLTEALRIALNQYYQTTMYLSYKTLLRGDDMKLSFSAATCYLA